MEYCKRLIEVDLPIKKISVQARREKDMRRGHIPLLHIWPATRPPAACRSVICASLWPDPSDPLCPDNFISIAKNEMLSWAKYRLNLLSEESFTRFVKYQKNSKLLENNVELRGALLDFIADFSNWDNSTNKEYLKTIRKLTESSMAEGKLSSKPVVNDPFTGGGAIPLEASRVGAEVYASELNPIAVLIDKLYLNISPSMERNF